MTTTIVMVKRIVAFDANGEPVWRRIAEVRLIEEERKNG